MSMESFKDQVLRVGQQASFAVQMKGKKGKISASVTSPSGAQIECSVAELDEGMFNHSLFFGFSKFERFWRSLFFFFMF